ncbi:MAG: tRNA lysidine(34) synthetase TilS [Verrucomicrobia bacterium]|nr:tRNA lysidine(34) synthetase TilS [Verrucomicrobiota bacterium]
MRDPLVQKVRAFLAPRCEPGRPLLLGYSGGPDSKALLYLLLECRNALRLELCLAHVDHGWRAESADEARAIAAEAEGLQLKLFSCRLSGNGMLQRNAEEKARDSRFRFFQEVYRETDAQGLLLAHQADDQAETVLKRLLEGAHPMHWPGIEAEGRMGGMRTLRPLLGITKKELALWLEERGHAPFIDGSNLDPRFLRGRMRSQIIPSLSAQFGKEISHNLCKAASASAEIHAYLMKRCEPHWKKLVCTGPTTQWDLTEVKEALELRWLLKIWVEKQKLHVSYEVLQAICAGLLERESNKRFPLKSGVIHINCGVLIFNQDG